FYLAFRGKLRIATPIGKSIIILCLLWLASQCVTDSVRHSAFADYARGWSNIGMTVVNFAALCTLLYGRPRRLMLYGWGLVLGKVLAYFISPNIFAGEYPWKFGFAFPVTWAVFLFASREKCRGHWPITLSASIGIINVVAGARSLGGICLAAAIYLAITRHMRKKGAVSFTLKPRAMVMIAASIVISAAGVLWAYQYAAGSGILGWHAQEKYESQSSGQYGMLLGGRVEMLGYLPAIYDSPLLGHGSWAKDPTYLIAERQALALMGYNFAEDISPDDLEEGLIPTHSYIFGAWVDAGILGAIFWGWVWVLTARVLMRVYPATAVLLPFVAFIAFELLWDLLFSPYGAEWRIIVPFYIVILMTCSDMVPRNAARAAPRGVKRRNLSALTPGPEPGSAHT
ncbi:MAG: hypothetical protein WCD70_04360, partial [Alphaproteobacteria bacterium]